MGKGPAVLVVPGLWGGSDLLMPLISELAKNCRVHWFDWPGDGRSIQVERGRNAFRPDSILKAVVDAAGERELTIVAHSFGAWAALKAFDATDDARIRGLVLTGAGSCDAHRPADAFLRRLRKDGQFSGGDAFLAALAKAALGASATKARVLKTALSALSRTSPAALALRTAWLREAKASAATLSPPVPVSILAGDRDTVEPLHSQVLLARAISSQVVALPGAGHLAGLTHPQELSRAIVCEMIRANAGMAPLRSAEPE